MKKLFIVTMCSILFISCSNTDEMDINMGENTEMHGLPENLSKELNNFITSLPQNSSTRSTGNTPSYTIKSVASVTTENISTRSKEVLPDTIMHLVSFDDGYAVITHNLLDNNIIAFAEQGGLNMNFFKNATPDKYLEKTERTISSSNSENVPEEDITNFTEEEFSNYLSEMIYMYAVRVAENKKAVATRIDIDAIYHYTTDDLNWYLTHPMIKTKWHQNSPFNTFASETLGKFVYAGCGNIAVAQLFTYYGFPNRLTNGYTFSQSDYTSARNVQSYYDATYSSGTSAEQKLVSEFIYNIGVCQYADWGSSGTSTYTTNTAALLKSCGYNNVVLKDFDALRIGYLVLEGDGCPILMRGSRNTGSGISGHMWIVDGIALVIPKNGFGIATTIHCNFGWGGINDGWYEADLFQRNVINHFPMTEYGDIATSSMYAYTLNQQVIAYDPF